MITEIKKKRLRYIVPFAYEPEGVGLDELCEKLTGNGQGAKWIYELPREGEQDIYHLFEDTFRPGRKNHENIGCSLKYTERDENGEILRIRYTRGENLPEYIFHISDAGVYLFRTGVGLFWYEILENKIPENENPENDNPGNKDPKNEIPENKNREAGLNIEDLILFQNRFKELNSSRFKWYNQDNPRYDETGKIIPEYIAEFHLEKPDGRSVGNTMGLWIREFLGSLNCKIKFYPDRKDWNNKEILVPDKAILFQYLVGEAEKEADMEEAAFYLSNGYNRSYRIPEGVLERMFRPFQGACWYVTKGGCGYYVRNEPVNEYFFLHYMPRKMVNDYFVLYILLLYQSYSLLHFTNEIEQDMSADSRVYREASPAVSEWLEEFETKINVFLIKSVYSSVSHIQHQNDFYEYASKQLRIREDIDSLTLGLRSLDELQQLRRQRKEEEQEEKLSTALGVLSLLAIVSGFSDGFGFVDQMTLYFRGTGWTVIDYVTHVGIFILVLFVAYFAVKSVGKVFIRMVREELGKKKKNK